MTNKTPNEQYLTIAQACEITGKSESTMRRFIRSNQVRPADEFPQKFIKEDSEHGHMWLILKDFLADEFTLRQDVQPAPVANAGAGADSYFPMRIEDLEGQVDTYKTQVEQLIESNRDNQRESNVIIKGFQEQLQYNQKQLSAGPTDGGAEEATNVNGLDPRWVIGGLAACMMFFLGWYAYMDGIVDSTQDKLDKTAYELRSAQESVTRAETELAQLKKGQSVSATSITQKDEELKSLNRELRETEKAYRHHLLATGQASPVLAKKIMEVANE